MLLFFGVSLVGVVVGIYTISRQFWFRPLFFSSAKQEGERRKRGAVR